MAEWESWDDSKLTHPIQITSLNVYVFKLHVLKCNYNFSDTDVIYNFLSHHITLPKKKCPEHLGVCYYFQNIHSLLVWPGF